jgi:hypothetical protein
VTVVNAAAGVYWRGNPPNWNSPIQKVGYGVYNGDRVELECWTTGSTVPPLNNNRLWYKARIVSGRGKGEGFVNDHFLNTGINQPNVKVPGVPACGASPSPTPGPTPTPTQDLSRYAGYIVTWDGDKKAQKTSWLVGPDLKRRWISDIGTYNCLVSRGAKRWPSPLPASVLDRLTDLNGISAICADYMILDSRGSGSALEPTQMMEHFVGKLRALLPSKKIKFEANPYPAVGVFSWPWNPSEILNGLGAFFKFAQVGAYHDSVVTGKNWLSAEISRVILADPKVKIILLGYSQGAQVAGDVYQNTSRANLIGAVLFGDPYFNGSDSEHDRVMGGLTGRNGILTQPPSQPRPHFIGHVLSFCHPHDLICQGPTQAVHLLHDHENYAELGEPEVAAQRASAW